MTSLLPSAARLIGLVVWFATRLAIAAAFGSIMMVAATLACSLGRFAFGRKAAAAATNGILRIVGMPVRLAAAY